MVKQHGVQSLLDSEFCDYNIELATIQESLHNCNCVFRSFTKSILKDRPDLNSEKHTRVFIVLYTPQPSHLYLR